jgi:hypothetical protein
MVVNLKRQIIIIIISKRDMLNVNLILDLLCWQTCRHYIVIIIIIIIIIIIDSRVVVVFMDSVSMLSNHATSQNTCSTFALAISFQLLFR